MAVSARADAPPSEGAIDRVQRLTAELDRFGDSEARRAGEELVGAVIELYGEGLERMFAILDEGDGATVAEVRERLAGDGVVASLLLIHGLYPVGLDQRVNEALDSVRPYMESHGGDVELLGLEEGVARIRLNGSCEGCPASASTLELAIKQALDEAAPDLEGLVVEGAVATPSPAGPGALELPVIEVASGGPGPQPSWTELDGVVSVGEGEIRAADVRGVELIVARVEGNLLAFLDSCADCGAALSEAELSEGVLACPSCTRSYFLPRAGRSLDDDQLHLAPVPLLNGAGGARVALPS